MSTAGLVSRRHNMRQRGDVCWKIAFSQIDNNSSRCFTPAVACKQQQQQQKIIEHFPAISVCALVCEPLGSSRCCSVWLQLNLSSTFLLLSLICLEGFWLIFINSLNLLIFYGFIMESFGRYYHSISLFFQPKVSCSKPIKLNSQADDSGWMRRLSELT